MAGKLMYRMYTSFSVANGSSAVANGILASEFRGGKACIAAGIVCGFLSGIATSDAIRYKALYNGRRDRTEDG